MRVKQSRFNYNHTANNIIQEGKPIFKQIKGNWQSQYFANKNPITIELACGYGEYTTGLAKTFPERNFIGIDIKGDRLWQGSMIANEENLTNVAFLRCLIHDLDNYLAKDEISEIWLTFPDPRPKTKDIRRRLTGNRFLELYKETLKPDGWLMIKTDDTNLFDYSLKVLEQRDDIVDLEFTYNLTTSEMLSDHHGITTRYEQIFHKEGESIKYLKFRFKHE